MVPRILIVDDENDFIELLQYKLAGHGYDLIVANDGVHALSQARLLKPSLILLDILRRTNQGMHLVLAYAWNPLLATAVAGGTGYCERM